MAEPSVRPIWGAGIKRAVRRLGGLVLALSGIALISAIAAPRIREFSSPASAAPRAGPRDAEADRNPATAFEPSDWPIGTVALVLAGILVVLVVAPLILWWAYPNATSDVNRALAVKPPGPRLQVHPQADLARFRAAEERELNAYYWIDKEKGIVHIPIAEAMRRLARQGIPGFPQAPQ